MDTKLEVVVLPVSDVDRAKQFYAALGWREDADFRGDEAFRVVQMTPPGSPASIIFGKGVTDATPGSVRDLVLAVDDIEMPRAWRKCTQRSPAPYWRARDIWCKLGWRCVR